MSLTEMPHKIVFLLPFLILALLSPLACADPDRPHHDHSKHASPAGDKPSSSKPKALGLRSPLFVQCSVLVSRFMFTSQIPLHALLLSLLECLS